MSGIGSYSRLHRTADNRGDGDSAQYASLSRGVEIGVGASQPAASRESCDGSLSSELRVAKVSFVCWPLMVFDDPIDSSVCEDNCVKCRLYGSTYALRAFYSALEYVSRSGEVWCEGARIFMNPISRHFNPHNAQRCLMFAVFFTPQYGDSFIEVLFSMWNETQAIRLSMITSDELLMFGRSNNPCFLSALMASRNYSAIINKCVYSDPNYGSCWFRAKLFPLGSAEEVVFRAIKFTAHEVAIVSNVYYDAMLAYARRLKAKRGKAKNRLSAESVPFIPSYLREKNMQSATKMLSLDNGHIEKRANKMGVRNSLFSYSFQPYQMVTTPIPLTVGKKLKILFGTSQIEA